jgi:MFS family permease
MTASDLSVPEGDSGDAPHADSGAYWMLALLWLLYSLAFLDRYILGMLVDPIKADLGLSDFQISLILGPAFAICYAIATLPAGWAADRFPRRTVAYVGVTLWSIASMSSGFANSFPALFAARVCVGVGEAGLSPTAYAMIADRFPRNRLTTASAIFQTGIKAGSAAAFGIGGLLLTVAIGLGHLDFFSFSLAPWQMVMVWVGLPGLILGPLLFLVSEPKRKAVAAVDKPSLRPFLLAHRRLLIPVMIGFSLASICSSATMAWVPTYINRAFGWSPLHYGAVLSGLSALGALVLVAKSSIVDWLFARGMRDAHVRFYCWILAISIPVSIYIFFVKDIYVFFAMLAFLQVAMISYSVYATASLSLITPHALRGRVTALFLLFVNLAGSGLGALVVGALTDYVFKDQQKLGMSLALTMGVAMPGALAALWYSLAEWRRIIGPGSEAATV